MAVRRSHSHWIREQSSNGGSPVQRDARVDCSARSITGAIWYQGESNEKHAAQYRTLLQAMTACWRRLFAQGDFPFYIVSLPMYKHHRDTSVEDSWAEVSGAQALRREKSTEFLLGGDGGYRRPRHGPSH